MIETSQSLDIPDWLRGAMTEIRHLKDEGDRAQFWNAGIVGMAAAQVLQERLGEETGVNFAEEYPALTDAMQRVATTAKKRPAALGGKLRDGLVLIGNHYQKKTGLSAVWRGDVQQQAPTVEITADASFEGLRYKTKSAWVSLEDAKGIYGDGFDPYADPAWCLSPDGKSVTRADDYYVGNYAEFLRRVDADIASAASDDIRAKLLRQKLDAGARIDKVDVSKLTFNLFSPHVTLEEKAEFLRRFVHPSAAVIYDERTGEKRVDIDVPGSNLTEPREAAEPHRRLPEEWHDHAGRREAGHGRRQGASRAAPDGEYRQRAVQRLGARQSSHRRAPGGSGGRPSEAAFPPGRG